MTAIPRRLLRLRDGALYEGEQVLWQGRPAAWAELKATSVVWWLGVPWVAMTAFARFMNWIDEAAFPLFLVGAVIMAIPVLNFVRDLQTLYLITDRRALIVRGPWKDGKSFSSSTSYNRMDRPVVETISGDVGDLRFASGFSPKNEDADQDGRYGFRCVKNADKVRDLLTQAIAKYA